MNETILVTGGSGFIGFHLCKKLIKENKNVISIDNMNNYYDVSLKNDRLDELGLFSDLRLKATRKLVAQEPHLSSYSFVCQSLFAKLPMGSSHPICPLKFHRQPALCCPQCPYQ